MKSSYATIAALALLAAIPPASARQAAPPYKNYFFETDPVNKNLAVGYEKGSGPGDAGYTIAVLSNHGGAATVVESRARELIQQGRN